MLKLKLLHPGILAGLASNGHGAKVLIADGNFPSGTQTPAHAQKIYLNLAPGMVKVTDVLQAINGFIVVEKAHMMSPPDGSAHPIHEDLEEILPVQCERAYHFRFDFYELAKSNDVCMVIITGELRRFGNVLLEIGAIKQEQWTEEELLFHADVPQ